MAKKEIVIWSIVAVLVLGAIYIPNYLRIRELARQNRELEQAIKEIAQANKRLSEEHRKLQSDPIYLEKVAREKLGVARKGEIVYKVLPAPED